MNDQLNQEPLESPLADACEVPAKETVQTGSGPEDFPAVETGAGEVKPDPVKEPEQVDISSERAEAIARGIAEAEDDGTEEMPTGHIPTVKEICDELRVDIRNLGTRILELRRHNDFSGSPEDYVGQQSEMRANIMLAYRCLENARMRVGKILQAADDGVSILDK